MGNSWVPQSAAALASGALALALGALMLPSSDGGQVVATAQEHHARWLMASVAYFIAAVGLTMGLPAVLSLVDERGRGRRTLGLGVGVFALGTIGLAGYAAMLVFFRALVRDDVITAAQLSGVARDPGMLTFLGAIVVSLSIGELLIALALLRTRTAPRWVPLLMFVHAVGLVLRRLVPDDVQPFMMVLLGVSLVGAAVAANDAANPVTRPVRRLAPQ